MAADKAAVASGADLGDGLRKRPVAASQPAPALVVQPEDNKKALKKVRILAARDDNDKC
jgi:dolichyl-phosphate-mannose-protein mannosyltransferase